MSRSPPVLPYRVLPAEFVLPSSDGWAVIVDGMAQGRLADGAPFQSWDARLHFTLEREFTIRDDIARTLAVDARGSCADIVVIASSAGGAYRQVLCRQPIDGGGGSTIKVRAVPNSEQLAKDLTITTGVYLSRTFVSRDQLAPTWKGSRLWEHVERIRLEGGSARLPMYEVPFSDAFPGDGIALADFHVDILDEPELDLESALTVYINSERPDFAREVAKPGNDAEHRLWNGILRRALVTAVFADNVLSPTVHPPGSVGSTLQRWASQVWGDVQVEKLRESAVSDFSMFEATIESWLVAVTRSPASPTKA